MALLTLPSLLLRATPVVMDQWESEAVRLQNGYLHLVFTRTKDGVPIAVEVRDWETFAPIVPARPWGCIFGCAVVVGSVIHIYGRTPGGVAPWSVKHYTISPDDGWVLHDLGVVWTFAQNQAVNNLGVCASPVGYKILAEWIENGVIVLSSTDAHTFTFEAHIRPGLYTACPQPFYLNDRFYFTYLNRMPWQWVPGGTVFCTVACRTNGNTFTGPLTDSAKILLFPDHIYQDSISLGDVSLAEGDGEVAIAFSADDQGLPGGPPVYSALRQGFYRRGGLATLMGELF